MKKDVGLGLTFMLKWPGPNEEKMCAWPNPYPEVGWVNEEKIWAWA